MIPSRYPYDTVCKPYRYKETETETETKDREKEEEKNQKPKTIDRDRLGRRSIDLIVAFRAFARYLRRFTA